MSFKRFKFLIKRHLPATVLLFLLLVSTNLYAQVVRDSFDFLKIPQSARQMGLGGQNISSYHRDPNSFLSNPGTLSSETSGLGSVNFIPYPGKINFLSSTFNKSLKNYGVVGAGLSYISYGNIESYDATGEPVGSYSASEYSLVIGNAHNIGPFTLGVNLKLSGSNISNYSSYAILGDIGGVFKHPEKEIYLALTIQNAGLYLKKYTNLSNSSLPFDVLIGGSFKPEHMPLKVSVTLHRLDQFQTTDVNQEKITFADQLFRHVIIGAEVLVSKNVHLRGGYNYMIRRELSYEQRKGGSGFTLGGMVRVKSFEFAYSRGFFAAGGSQNCFTIISDFNIFFNKKASE